MEHLAIMLVVISAVLHAGWNLLGKRYSGSGISFALAASLAASFILLPYLLWYLTVIGFERLPKEFWQLLLLSGFCQIVYMVGLVYAYKHADIGVIYPIARALPVLIVGAANLLLGFPLTLMQWCGFALITLGCVFVPLTSFTQVTFKAYWNWGVFWALVAAVGTAGYSIIDKQALSLLSQAAYSLLNDKQSAVFYLGAQFWAMGLPILFWCLLTNNKQEIIKAWHMRKNGSLAGIMMATTYGLVLSAMTMTDNVSLVVALRQISIVFGLLMGVWFLKERWFATRSLSVITILLGLFLSLA